MSSLAQEESRSISENCTWGQRKRFADGKVTVPFKRFLGYDRGPDGNLVLNKDEAVIIRRIYSMFLQGMTPHGIAARLTADGIKSPGGKDKWNAGAVRSILTNEKYKGDALLQKSYTVDFLTKKKKVNEGEIPQYYVEGNHEAIIQPEVFELVQQELERRKNSRGRHSGVHLFSGKIRCGQCGEWYGSKVWHSNSKYRRVIWQCNHKYDGEKKCSTPHLTEDEIKYDKHSFSAHAGDGIYYMSVSDASGIMPPKSETFAWFGITSTPRGGRNNLKADNDWLIALTTQEMHIENIQSVKDELREKERAETEAAAARAKQARDAEVKILTAERLIRELKQQQDDFAWMKRQYEISFTELRRKLDMEKEKTERKFAEAVRKEHQARQMARQLREESIRETRDAAVSALESMRKQTWDEIQALRQRTDETIRRLKPDCHGGK